jgi:ATP-binding protein involved in chromosome partitioning
MPPGTGDIQLTLSQKVPVSAAVVVTTPQELALADARRGIDMFRKVNIEVAGIVENMSYFKCPCCDHKEAIFGEGGGAALALETGTRLLGQLPLDSRIRTDTDGGKPTVIASPDSDVSAIYRHIARKIGVLIWQNAEQSTSSIPTISIED